MAQYLSVSSSAREHYESCLHKLLQSDPSVTLYTPPGDNSQQLFLRNRSTCTFITDAEFEGDCLNWMINTLHKKTHLPALLVLAISHHATSNITGSDLENCCINDGSDTSAASMNNNSGAVEESDGTVTSSLSDGTNQHHCDGDDCDTSHDSDHMLISCDKLYQLASTRIMELVSLWHQQHIPSHVILQDNPIIDEISNHSAKNLRRKMEDTQHMLISVPTLYSLTHVNLQTVVSVFDGHGGAEASQYAATHLATQLTSSPHYPHDMGTALKDAYRRTDEMFRDKAKHTKWRSGSTGVTAVIGPTHLHVAWCGDSSAVLVRSGEAPLTLVTPHTLEDESERDRVRAAGGHVSQMGEQWRCDLSLSVSRALGDPDYKPHVCAAADVWSGELTARDHFLILATDGLWDVVTPERVVEVVRGRGKKSEVGKALVQEAKDLGSLDNITVVVVFFNKQVVRDVASYYHSSASAASASTSTGTAHVKGTAAAPTTVKDPSATNIGEAQSDVGHRGDVALPDTRATTTTVLDPAEDSDDYHSCHSDLDGVV